MHSTTILIALTGFALLFIVAYVRIRKYGGSRREGVLITASSILLGVCYASALNMKLIPIVLVAGSILIGLFLVFVIISKLIERVGEVSYEGQDKSMDAIPKFKQKSKRKSKHDEKPKRTEKPKNDQLPY